MTLDRKLKQMMKYSSFGRGMYVNLGFNSRNLEQEVTPEPYKLDNKDERSHRFLNK